MYNAGDRKDVRKAEKAARLSAVQRQSAVSGIMSVTGGRHWMHDVLVSCHCFATTFAIDPHASAFNEGQRSIGLLLLADIMSASADNYVLMMREANEREKTQEAREGNGQQELELEGEQSWSLGSSN